MRWNVSYVDEKDIKSNGSFTDKKYDNDDIFNANLVAQNIVDLYFRQIQMSGEMIEEQNIQLSPAVGYTTTRLLQCIHRKDDENNRDLLAGLRGLSTAFWLKLALIYLFLSLILIASYFVKRRRTIRRRLPMSSKSWLNELIIALLLFYVRIITRQSSHQRYYRNLKFVRYLVLLVIILFSVVIQQVLFYASFRDLKFRNTTYILKDLNQVLFTCFFIKSRF